MSVAAFSINNRVVVSIVYILCFAIGILAFIGSVVDVYPEVSFDAGQILVAWPGASPEEIEASITNKIEDEIEDVRGIDRIVSSSERNLAIIDVKFREDLSDTEFNRNFEDLRASVQRVSDLPAEAEKPQVRKITVNELYPLLQVVVAASDDSGMEVVRAVALSLRERLQRIDGVMRVSDIGIPELEWWILVKRDALRTAGLDLLAVADALRARHQNLPGGSLPTAGGEFAVAATGEFRTVEALQELIVGYRTDQSPIKLREVATVRPGFEKADHVNRANGKACINLSVAKEADSHALRIRRAIQAEFARFRAEESVPDNIDIGITIDTTRILEDRINVLLNNLGFGVFLVFGVLWLFLGSRNSFLAVLGIPFSFLLAFAVLSQMGVTINAITLFSLVLVSGMVVDDAIVVLDNIYRHVQSGAPLRDAIVRGVSEVTWPVISACLTTVAAFIPMLIMSGVVGEFMSIIPKTITAVLLASLFECLFLLPAHYLHRGEKNPMRGIVRATNERFDALGRAYSRLLARLLRHPWKVVGTISLLGVLAMFVWRRLPVELFPSDFQAFYCNVFVDPESGLEATSEAVREVEKIIAEEMPGKVESYTTSVGATFTDDNQLLLKPNVAQILVYASDEYTATRGPQNLIREIRTKTDALVGKPGRFRFQRIKVDTFNDGPPVGKPVAVRLSTPDYGEGKAVAREFIAALEAMSGVHSISDNLDEGPREAHIVPKEERAAERGLPFLAIGRTIVCANEGLETGTLLPEGSEEEVVLRVLLRPEDRQDPSDLLLLPLRIPNGEVIALSEVAELETRRGPASRYHYDGERTVLVTADVDTKVTDSETVNLALMSKFQDLERRHPQLSVVYGGEFEETNKSFDSLKKAFAIAILLIYAVLAAQFRSFSLPFVIMTVVPFSYIGVVLGLWIMGFPFTIIAFIAIVGLSGVVVNDSIVLVEFIAAARERGEELIPAILNGCTTRLRAIFLTTVTTVFGLLPTALGLTGYSKIWSPFAATISFGLTLAMFLTLFLVPAVFVLIDRRRKSPSAQGH